MAAIAKAVQNAVSSRNAALELGKLVVRNIIGEPTEAGNVRVTLDLGTFFKVSESMRAVNKKDGAVAHYAGKKVTDQFGKATFVFDDVMGHKLFAKYVDFKPEFYMNAAEAATLHEPYATTREVVTI
jgi:hypothetical protein